MNTPCGFSGEDLIIRGEGRMRIAICDDDPTEQERFIRALRDWDSTKDAERFSDGASLLAAAKTSPPFHIVFLDIYLPGASGIEIARTLRALSPDTSIVFVTNSAEHAVDAFSLYALHYLVKPVTAQGVEEAFRRLENSRVSRRATISFTVGRDSHTVFLDQIYCLESVNHAVEVLLADGRRLKVWTSLNELEQKLDGNFLKINRGTVVNMAHIEQMGVDTCILRDGSRLVLTKRDRVAIRAAYNDYLFSLLSQRKGFDEVEP